MKSMDWKMSDSAPLYGLVIIVLGLATLAGVVVAIIRVLG